MDLYSLRHRSSPAGKRKVRKLAFSRNSLIVLTRTVYSEALAASNVKIASRDVLATWKVLVALGLTPLLYGFYGFLSFLSALNQGASLCRLVIAPTVTLLLLPSVAYAALKFGEAGLDVLK